MKLQIRIGMAVLLLHAGSAIAQENQADPAHGNVVWAYDSGG